MNTTLWVLFIALQAFGAGNINYQQEQGREEINPIYGSHPSKGRVYLTKAAEIGVIYGATALFPEHKEAILGFACGIAVGFISYDAMRGIELKVRF